MFGAIALPQGVTICGSCVMTPLPSPPDEDAMLEKASEVDVGYDLSFLDDKGRKRLKAVSQSAVRMALSKTALLIPIPISEVTMKRLKLKSNSIRDRLAPVGDMMLSFDGSGVAEFPESRLETVNQHMRLRPGRFRILQEDKPAAPKKDSMVALEAARERLEAARAEAPPSEPTPEPEPKATPVAKKKAPAKKKKQPIKKEASEE